MDMELIDRTWYTARIRQWIGKEMIIVLTGQRRVGKSQCLRLIRREAEKENDANVIYIDKEDAAFDGIKTFSDLNEHITRFFQADRHNYILIDEVQDIEGFERSVRSWIKQTHTDVIITGNNAKMLSSELSTLLAARYVEIPVHSLSYTEFLTFHDIEDSDSALENYLTWGGLPYLRELGLRNTKQMADYLHNVYNTILLKDIILREQIRNVQFLENLGRFMSDNIGKLLSPNSIMKYQRSQGETVSASVIQNYLTYFCNAYIAHRIFRFDVHGKQLLENNEKYYFEDLGLRNILVRSTPQNDIEKRMENAVCLHLLRCGYKVTVGQLHNAEIDFVAERNGETVYVQVSYLIADEATHKREFGNLLAIRDNYRKMVVSLNPMNTDTTVDGIRHLHLRRFLTAEDI